MSESSPRCIRCLIVDDEPLARDGIQALLSCRPDCDVVLSTGDSSLALRRAHHGVDLIFLDIQMPGINGIEFLKRLRQFRTHDPSSPYVILVTALDGYALQAFEHEALDYLVKPFSDERFDESLKRARRRLFGPSETRECTDSTSDFAQTTFKTRLGDLELKHSEICWIESMGHYISIHCVKRSFLSRTSISTAEDKLKGHGFIRVHRKAIVNRARIEEIRVCDDGRHLLLDDGSSIQVSRRRWNEVRSQLAVDL